MSFEEYIDQEVVVKLRTKIKNTLDLLPQPLNERFHDYILTNSGKMLRPLLIINVAKILGVKENNGESVYSAAIVLEMLHSMTLIHDDVIDGAPLRRGLPSYHKTHGIRRAISDGDILHNFVLTLIKNEEFLNTILSISYRVCSGNALELEDRFNDNFDISEDHIIKIMHQKTAEVFYGCVLLGCIAAERSELAETVKEIILDAGTAFQIQDDILDVFGKEEEFGKKKYWDIQESKRNLFLLYALQESNRKKRLIEIYRKKIGEKSKEEVDFVLVEFFKVKERVIKKRDTLLESCIERLDKLIEKTEKETDIEFFEYLRVLFIYLCSRQK